MSRAFQVALGCCLVIAAAGDRGHALRGAHAGLGAQGLLAAPKLELMGKDDRGGPEIMGKSLTQGKKYSSTCMYLVATLVVSCFCISPGAQYLSTKHAKAGAALSCFNTFIPIGVFVYLFFFTTVPTDYWKGGFASVGAWCGGLCIYAIILGLCLSCQLCFMVAVATGMYTGDKTSMHAVAQSTYEDRR